ncbi:MAG TPA: sigma-70 family RNA polymerase sigma factor [Kofleriaceae bacterium]|nr:sigma-70 family RNA polymerase sigma factor [Kofleriaceae bacterium]
MTLAAVPWSDVAAQLRPFVAGRVANADVDDVLQDVLLRIHRGLGDLADDQRFTAWMYRVARSAIGEHGRARARHPVAEQREEPVSYDGDDRAAAAALAACLTGFVARLPSPYREAVTLVELEGLTAREAAELAGVSISGMKSRVQRGRAQLRNMLDACCAIALDIRRKVTDVVPRGSRCCPPPKSRG